MKSESEVREGQSQELANQSIESPRPAPHKFESISGEEWKAGKSRYQCAICGLDYSDPTHVTK